MRKYWNIFALAWQNGLVYRTNFLIWRFRQLLSTLMALTIWGTIFSGTASAFGYSSAEMTSYILLVSMLQGLILATSLNGLASEINSGNISHHFLKPQRMFLSLAANEAADKSRNLIFSIIEAGILIALFHPPIIFPGLGTLLFFVLWCALGVLIYFYLTILFGCIGFWSPETWGPKFLFFMFLDFTAGKLFPLDILPSFIQKILYLTPFPYFSYVQIQLFLERLSDLAKLQISAGLIVWTIITWWLASYYWRKGSHSFEAAGL